MLENESIETASRSLMRKAYYDVRSTLPRGLQLFLRRHWVLRVRRRHAQVWPVDARAANPPSGWSGWPEGKQFALVLTHDVETAIGQEKCLRLAAQEEELGFRSSFNFVAERYPVFPDLRRELVQRGFEVGVHGLLHDGKLFDSRAEFERRAHRINMYLREWNAVGFRAPSMQRNFDWMHALDIDYDSSSFDTDPFEPQPDGVHTIFPFYVHGPLSKKGFVELPYTLPQDFLLFVLLRERDIAIWKNKLEWIAQKGGMALLDTHPDYMCFDSGQRGREEYPAELYAEFLRHIRKAYENQFWHVLPREVSRFWVQRSGSTHPNGSR